jgi:hypothetical protein
MKLYTKEQLQEAYNRGHMDGRLNNIDYSIIDGFKPIELPNHRDIMERTNQQVDKTIDNYFVGFAACSEYYEQILRQLPIIKTNGTSISQVDTNGIRN